MSLLREIMGRLSHRGAAGPLESPADAPPSHEQQAYAGQLAAAADADLLYEWEWLEQRLAALAPAAAEERHRLLAWRTALTAAFQERSLSPIKAPAAVDPACHAWELRDPALRGAWHLG